MLGRLLLLRESPTLSAIEYIINLIKAKGAKATVVTHVLSMSIFYSSEVLESISELRLTTNIVAVNR